MEAPTECGRGGWSDPKWRELAAVVTIIYFILIPLPTHWANFRKQVAFISVGVVLIYAQLKPLVSAAWTGLTLLPADLYSAVCRALSPLSLGRVWLGAAPWVLLVILFAVWAWSKAAFKTTITLISDYLIFWGVKCNVYIINK